MTFFSDSNFFFSKKYQSHFTLSAKSKIVHSLLKIIIATLFEITTFSPYSFVYTSFELNFNVLFSFNFDKSIFSLVGDNLSESFVSDCQLQQKGNKMMKGQHKYFLSNWKHCWKLFIRFLSRTVPERLFRHSTPIFKLWSPRCKQISSDHIRQTTQHNNIHKSLKTIPFQCKKLQTKTI